MAPPERPQEDFSLKETTPNIGGGRISGSEKLTSSFDLVEQMHFLFVRVVKARALPLNSDPFVEVQIGNYKGTTRYFEKNPNPEWNQVFAFTKERLQGTQIDIFVKACNDCLIGKYAFNVWEIPTRVPPDGPLAPQWYSLDDISGNKIPGELMLCVWIGTQADEVFSEAWHSDTASVHGDSIINTRSKVYLSPKLWYLRVNIIEAQDLVIGNRNRNPEVFVKAMLGNLVMRSRTSPEKSINPTWNEDLMFVAVEPFDDSLILTLEDKMGNKEECLGRCEIKLSQVERNIIGIPAAPSWYNLDLHVPGPDEGTVEVRFAGRVHLRVSLDGGYHVIDESIHYSSDFRASAKILWKPTIGVLELGILSATGLAPMKSRDGRGTTDAYCVAKYGQKWVRTRTIIDSFAPKWNEQYTWEVYDPCTVVTIAVFDNWNLQGGDKDKIPAGANPRIGKVRIRLSTLGTDRIYTHSYPLIVLQPNGVKKMGEIQLAVRFTCSSFYDMMHSYTQPLLPVMHYTQPLSVYQLESLRHQAAHILSLGLARNEPPLRREVVEYMLDVGSNVWSMRKGRANYYRILAIVNGLVNGWKRFDSIRKWENPWTSVTVHVALFAVVFLPKLAVSAGFAYYFLVGVVGYRGRPRHPPHMDIKLSHADTVSLEDLDEEFDSYPSSKTGNVMKARYDRLRSVAGRMMSLLGDLAVQGERVHALLSWRDPRATFVFILFCLCAAVFIYFVPLRMFVLVCGCYVIRHPRVRIDLPSIPQNFFRRLPARTDCML